MKHKGCYSKRNGIDNDVLYNEYVLFKMNVQQIAIKHNWAASTVKWRLQQMGCYENDTRKTRAYSKKKVETSVVENIEETKATEADALLSALGF